jgi:hypothetical protein
MPIHPHTSCVACPGQEERAGSSRSIQILRQDKLKASKGKATRVRACSIVLIDRSSVVIDPIKTYDVRVTGKLSTHIYTYAYSCCQWSKSL